MPRTAQRAGRQNGDIQPFGRKRLPRQPPANWTPWSATTWDYLCPGPSPDRESRASDDGIEHRGDQAGKGHIDPPRRQQRSNLRRFGQRLKVEFKTSVAKVPAFVG